MDAAIKTIQSHIVNKSDGETVKSFYERNSGDANTGR